MYFEWGSQRQANHRNLSKLCEISWAFPGDKSIFQMYMHEPVDICLLYPLAWLILGCCDLHLILHISSTCCEYSGISRSILARLLSLSPFLFVRVLFYTVPWHQVLARWIFSLVLFWFALYRATSQMTQLNWSSLSTSFCGTHMWAIPTCRGLIAVSLLPLAAWWAPNRSVHPCFQGNSNLSALDTSRSRATLCKWPFLTERQAFRMAPGSYVYGVSSNSTQMQICL